MDTHVHGKQDFLLAPSLRTIMNHDKDVVVELAVGISSIVHIPAGGLPPIPAVVAEFLISSS